MQRKYPTQFSLNIADTIPQGIFGMGFFSTSPDEQGNVNFSVSSNWWWYLAVTIPLTACVLFSMGGWQAYGKWRVGRRKIADLESDKESC